MADFYATTIKRHIKINLHIREPTINFEDGDIVCIGSTDSDVFNYIKQLRAVVACANNSSMILDCIKVHNSDSLQYQDYHEYNFDTVMVYKLRN